MNKLVIVSSSSSNQILLNVKNLKGRAFACGMLLTVATAFGQNSVQASPTSSQTITQPNGTSLTVQGNVDINTDGQAPALVVSGIDGSFGPTFQVINPGASCGGCNFLAGQFLANGNAGGNFSFNTALYASAQNGAINYAAIFANGNVGIGTEYPSGLLTIGSPAPDGMGSPTNGILFIDSLVGGGDIWSQAAVYTVGEPGYNADLAFGTVGSGLGGNPAERMRIMYNGNVGIGTSTPSALLEINGGAQVDGQLAFSSSGSGIKFADGSIQTKAAQGVANISSANGQIGIGTTTPQANLDVNGSPATDVVGTEDDFQLTRQAANGVSFPQVTAFQLGTYNSTGACCGPQSRLDINLKAAPNANLTGDTNVMTLLSSGSVGIGTTMPGSDLSSIASPPASTTPILEVNGDIAFTQTTVNGTVTGSGGGSVIFADGTVQSTAWNGTTLGGDYAESVDVQGKRETYEPGDIIAIDPTSPGNFTKAQNSYSRLVAGVYSTKPGLVGRRTTAARPDKKDEVPMAMMGIAPTKVSAENGSIEPGDLLVSSSTPGYAMKGTDTAKLSGAVIGKALASLTSGTGMIEVLVSLQ